VNPVIPAVGAAGSLLFVPLMLFTLYSREPHPFVLVIEIAALVLSVELLYFEPEFIEEEVEAVESELGAVGDNGPG
jgi:hypothetical protein